MAKYSPSQLASFAAKGKLLDNESAEIAKMEIDDLSFGTFLTTDSALSRKTLQSTSKWHKLTKFFKH
ncbi:hypothetical protein HDU92_008139 [Lobulomyces angularis]|nr:hypothetical protein HDU92_008139 [Lobulomyces angularis]